MTTLNTLQYKKFMKCLECMIPRRLPIIIYTYLTVIILTSCLPGMKKVVLLQRFGIFKSMVYRIQFLLLFYPVAHLVLSNS